MDASLASNARPPLLVLGVGNRLLRDDGVGIELLERLTTIIGASELVEFVDGGTQGLALLSFLEGRSGALILDAVVLGGNPGAVHVLRDRLDGVKARSTTAHGSSVNELLGVAELLGQLPGVVVILGIEPKLVRTGLGFSPEVEAAIPGALRSAARELGVLEARVKEAAHA